MKRSFGQGISNGRSQPRVTKHRGLRAALRSDTQVTLQYNIKKSLVSWKLNISSFFEESEESEGFQYNCHKRTLGQIYKLLRHVERKQTVDRLRRRILLVALHRLLQKFHRETVAGEALTELASAVLQSGLAGEDRDVITAELSNWTKKGRRYNALADGLRAVGSIVLLPYEIGDSMQVLSNDLGSALLIPLLDGSMSSQ